jgi:branched-chain amino acid transport system ATP-binding protein
VNEALALRGVSAGYGPFKAIFDISISLAPGEVLALLGPNGAGKSTVARVASGLVPVTQGAVIVGDEEVTGRSAHQIRRHGLLHVPEGRGVFGSLSVEENLKVAFLAQPRSVRRRCLAEAEARFPLLNERLRQRADTLSGGQQRLLSLAGALVAPPAVLVADELSLGLAPNVLDEIYGSLAELAARGTALVVIEQQIDRALALADRAAVISHGRIVFEGPAAQAGAAAAEHLGRTEGL